MGKEVKLQDAKDNFFLLCKQYEAFGMYRHAETLSMNGGDTQGAQVARSRCIEQYMEIGEQLKALGAALDRLGGPPILLADHDTEAAPDVEPLRGVQPDV